MKKGKWLHLMAAAGLALSSMSMVATSQAEAGASPYALQHETDAKHTPVVSAPAKVKAGEPFEVTINIGAKQHPSLVEHHVEWIQLYADEALIAHVQLAPTLTLPNVTLTVVLEHSADLKAVEAPNHATGWVSQPVHVRVVK